MIANRTAVVLGNDSRQLLIVSTSDVGSHFQRRIGGGSFVLKVSDTW